MDLCSQNILTLSQWMEQNGEKAFHAKQIFQWLYKKSVRDFSSMTNLSKDLQSKVQEAFVFPVLEKKEVIEAEEILKFLWQLKDGLFVESVVIFSEERVTLCLSSQVGCYGKCSFCASGKSGFFRNLSLAEIVEQYIHINREMNEKEKKINLQRELDVVKIEKQNLDSRLKETEIARAEAISNIKLQEERIRAAIELSRQSFFIGLDFVIY